MADEDEPAVTLGEGRPVEGAPLARVSARLMWGIEKSTVLDREGDTVIRTPDGPRTLVDVLAEVEEPYFATQQEFERAVRDVIGRGPVPTAGGESGADAGAEDVARTDDSDEN
jgi:hypothetical protein